ncbi:MAG TPA: hypothetical protein DCM62_08190 [Bacteroidales bacterium]|nr:hypothetical protein [Bacteroidales bacterium]
MKSAIQIVLALVIVVLGYLIYDSIMEPVHFNREAERREAAIIERLKDIRSIQLAHRTRHGRFLGDLDSLVNFVRFDSIAILRAIGTVPDTLTEAQALRLGIVERDTFWMPAMDTLLVHAAYPLDSLPFVPYSGGQRFSMASSMIERSMVMLPVFEAFAMPEQFLGNLPWRIYYTRKEGLRVGSIMEAKTDGNWE